MCEELYFGAAIEIKGTGRLSASKMRGARFWRAGTIPGTAWVLVWPTCRTSKPFAYLVPLSTVDLSDAEEEPPLMPEWTGAKAYEVIGCVMLPLEKVRS